MPGHNGHPIQTDESAILQQRLDAHAREMIADLEARARNLTQAAKTVAPELVEADPEGFTDIMRRLLASAVAVAVIA